MPQRKDIKVELNSLENGVSQQAAVARNKSQAESQINLISDLARGLVSRPPTQHIRKLLDRFDNCNDVAVFDINRDQHERYIVMISCDNINVFDAETGEEKVVNFPEGKDYLSSLNPAIDFDMLTVADTSWILNKSVTTQMTGSVSAGSPYQAIIYVKRGMRGHTYTVEAGGYRLTVNSESNVAGYAAECNTEDIARAIAVGTGEGDSYVPGLSSYGFDVKLSGSVVLISKSTDFKFKVYDSYGNQGLVGIKENTDDFANLPAVCWDGVKVRITGGDSTGLDDYYVEYRSSDETTTGDWVESVGWSLQNSIDSATMPHHLVRESDGSFTFKSISWQERKVGDELTAPPPGFIGNKINAIFFHMNRFGIASRDKLVFSRDDRYYTFFPRKAKEVLADDAFELTTTGNNISDISSVVPFAKTLIVMCENKQFIVTAENGFSPEETKITESTTCKASTVAKPALAGSNMFFISPNGDYSIVREYFLSEDSVTYQATDITKHVPEYIPKGVTLLDAHSNDDLLICFSPETPNKLYVYKYLWLGNEKAQSSWSYFEFGAEANVLHFCYFDNSINLTVQYPDGVYMENLTLFSKELDEGMDFDVGLDRKAILSGSYEEVSDLTTFTLPYQVTPEDDLRLVLGGGFAGKAGAEIKNFELVDSTTVTVKGNCSGKDVYCGVFYPWEYGLSTQYVRRESQAGMPALTAGRTQILRMSVAYSDSGTFKVEVRNRGQVNEYRKTGRIGAVESIIGKSVIDSGSFSVPVRAQNINAEITVKADSFVPVSLQKIEWEGYYSK